MTLTGTSYHGRFHRTRISPRAITAASRRVRVHRLPSVSLPRRRASSLGYAPSTHLPRAARGRRGARLRRDRCRPSPRAEREPRRCGEAVAGTKHGPCVRTRRHRRCRRRDVSGTADLAGGGLARPRVDVLHLLLLLPREEKRRRVARRGHAAPGRDLSCSERRSRVSSLATPALCRRRRRRTDERTNGRRDDRISRHGTAHVSS